jgi:hypothetical protein
MEIAKAVCVLGLTLSTTASLGKLPANSSCGEGVDLQIVTDKRVYAPGATIHVKFLVTNTDDWPLYLFSVINQCTSPLGSLSLHIRDQHNQEVTSPLCSADYFNMGELNPAQQLSDSKYGVQLLKDEIFGRLQQYKLPKKKGLYRLQAEIGPVGSLTEDQELELSKHQIRILRHTCSSAVVTVEVK